MAEQTFLNESNVYVSNARVVIYGTTYAMANITSVRQHTTPANRGCAIAVIVIGVLGLLSGLGDMMSRNSEAPALTVVMAVIIFIIGLAWYRSRKPMHHLLIATAAGERQGLSSPDGALVARVTNAIAEAITFRG